MYALDDGDRRGFKLVAADDSSFAVDDGHVYCEDILVFPERTGSFTIMNVLTRALVAKVSLIYIYIQLMVGVG